MGSNLSDHPNDTAVERPPYQMHIEELKRLPHVRLRTSEEGDIILIGFRDDRDYENRKEVVSKAISKIIYESEPMLVTEELVKPLLEMRKEKYQHEEEQAKSNWYFYYAYRFEFYHEDAITAFHSACLVLPRLGRIDLNNIRIMVCLVPTQLQETKDGE